MEDVGLTRVAGNTCWPSQVGRWGAPWAGGNILKWFIILRTTSVLDGLYTLPHGTHTHTLTLCGTVDGLLSGDYWSAMFRLGLLRLGLALLARHAPCPKHATVAQYSYNVPRPLLTLLHKPTLHPPLLSLSLGLQSAIARAYLKFKNNLNVFV